MYLVKSKKMLALLAAAVILVGCGFGLDAYSSQLTPRENWLTPTMATEATSVTWVTGETVAGENEETTHTTVPPTDASRPVDTAPKPDPGFWDIQENVKFIAAGITLVGLVFVGLYCWMGDMEPGKLGPDVESVGVIALALFLALVRDALWYSPWGVLAAGMVLGGLGILLLRGVTQWGKQGFPVQWCMCWRAGRPGSGIEGFYKIQFALMAAFLALGLGLREWRLLSGCVIFLSGFPIYCMMMLARDVDHFRDTVRQVCREKPVQAKQGCFLEEEQELAALQCSHTEAVKKAVAGERFKVELISNVSHDLRTPLTAILGYGELLVGESLSEEGTLRLEQLNKKAGYMKDLVDDLFELTKVSSGVAEANFGKIDLIRLLEQTLGLLDDRLEGAGLQVRRHYQAPSLELVTDGNRMHQVFVNLVDNAIKYALPGSRLHLYVSKGSRTVVRLVNTASYEMDFTAQEIVERFARGDKARSSQGSGIGLAIAQTYTASVGGGFRVEIDGDQFSAIVELP